MVFILKRQIFKYSVNKLWVSAFVIVVPEPLEDFIDFEAYGKYIGEYVEEYSGGLIEILR